MNKRNLFLDVDGVLINSIKAYCDYYRIIYGGNPDWTKVKVYDLQDQCPEVPNREHVINIFGTKLFFELVEFMPNAYESVMALNKMFNVILCSIGTYNNIHYKSAWIKENLPHVDKAIFINNRENTMNKSLVDMGDGIIIDDVGKNLETSNAEIKILFDNNFEWNAGCTNYNFKTYDWIEVFNYLLEGQ
jgi:5'(3')-deoxyribonucleotidase